MDSLAKGRDLQGRACLGKTLLALVILGVLAAPAPAVTTLRAIRSITEPAMTRLIVEFSAPVHYRLQRVPGRADLGVPARLYVEFDDTRLAETPQWPTELSEGPLLRLRATQRGAAATRLILDVPGLTEFGTFALPDPYRLIIDVRGAARAGTPRPTPQPAPAAAALPPPPQAPRPAASTAPAQRRFKIVLDPGHGGKDPGAFGVGGVAEKDVVLAIALRLKERLAAMPGIDAVLTRGTDIFLALEERTARANTEKADLFVSIHANASVNTSLSGAETYLLSNTNDRATLRLAEMENGLRTMTGHAGRDRDTALILSDLIQTYKIQESTALAEQLQQALVSALDANGTPVNNLGVKRGPFYVLVGAGMPCALVEVSFLTHPREGDRLARRPYQDAIAEGLLRGIQRFVENTRVTENL